MTGPDLNESAWQRAKSDTAGVCFSGIFGLTIVILELLAVPAAFFLSHREGVAVELTTPLITGAAALAIPVVAVLVFEVAAAPLRQRNELRQAWRLLPAEAPPNVPLVLKDLRRRGQDLLHGIDPRGYTSEDQGAVESWTEETVRFLSANCEPSHASEFIDASQRTPRFIPSLEKRIAKLDAIAESLG